VSESAQVTSIDAILAFRGALRKFESTATQAVMTLDEQSRRALHWLDNEAPEFWRLEIRRCSDLVARCRGELETCRMKTVAGQRAACLEQLEAFRAAQRKHRLAEEKLEVVRQWGQRIRRELDDYRGRTMPLRTALERDLPRTFGLLDRIITSLDAYAERTGSVPAEAATVPESMPPSPAAISETP